MSETGTVERFCPAKVNLFLAVTGRREDGFHELVSLMAPLEIGDRLRISVREDAETGFRADDPDLPTGETNLVLRAVEVFRRRFPFSMGLDIALEKKIPVGAGLGGGSSDAAGTILALNELLGQPLPHGDLYGIAAAVGSDCPFFLEDSPAVIRGRGERIEKVPEEVRERLAGVRLLLLRPGFPVATDWAYGAMVRRGSDYVTARAAEDRLGEWIRGRAGVEELFFNSMEAAVFDKYVPLAVLKGELRERVGAPVLMSGSGSTLVVAVETDEEVSAACEYFRNACGESGWSAVTRLRVGG